MERGVPIANWRMVAAEGEFEVIVVVVTDDVPFDFHRVARGLGVECDFTKVADLGRQRRSKVKVELAEIKAARDPFLIRCGVVHVAKTSNLKRWEVSFHLADRSLFLLPPMLVFLSGGRSGLLGRGLLGRGNARGGERRSWSSSLFAFQLGNTFRSYAAVTVSLSLWSLRVLERLAKFAYS